MRTLKLVFAGWLAIAASLQLSAKTFIANDLASWKAAITSISTFGGDTIKIAGDIIYNYGEGSNNISCDVTIMGETSAWGEPKYGIYGMYYGAGGFAGSLSISPENYCTIENIIVQETSGIAVTTQGLQTCVVKINNCISRRNSTGITVGGTNGNFVKLTISNCMVSDNMYSGIYIYGGIGSSINSHDITVHHCVMNRNRQDGIYVRYTDNVHIYDCTADNNGYSNADNYWGYGFSFGDDRNVTVDNCTATNNGLNGFSFYSTTKRNKISNSIASGNRLNGFYDLSDSHFTNCSAVKNGLCGFCLGAANDGSIINNCSATGNGWYSPEKWGEDGYYGQYGSNYGYGFSFYGSGLISNSTASGNRVGYYNDFYKKNTILNCTFSQNETGITGGNLNVYNSISYNNDECDLIFFNAYNSSVYNTVYGTDSLINYYGYGDISYTGCLTADPCLQGRTAAGGYTNNREKTAYYSLGETSSAKNWGDKTKVNLDDYLNSTSDWYQSIFTEDYVNRMTNRDQLDNERTFNGNRYDAGAVSGEGNVKIKKSVLSYSPKRAANYGKASILFYGNGFDEDTKITLKKQGESDIVQDTIIIGDIGVNKCTAVFNFHNKTSGKWDIAVNLGDTIIMLKEGFEIEPYTTTPNIEIELLGAAAPNVGNMVWTYYTVKYTNRGNMAVYNVPIIIEIETPPEAKVGIEEQWEYIVPEGLDLDSISRIDTLIHPFTGRLHTYIAPVVPRIEAYSAGYLVFRIIVQGPVVGQKVSISAAVFEPMLEFNPEAFEELSSSGGMLRAGGPCGLAASNKFSGCVQSAVDIGVAVGLDIANAIVPGVSCFTSAAEAGCNAGFDYYNPNISTGRYAANLAWDITTTALDCATDFFPPAKVAKWIWRTVKVMKTASDLVKYTNLAVDAYDNCKDKKKERRMEGDILVSVDPNDKTGPVSASGSKYLSKMDEFTYIINFENDPEKANSPAQEVWVTDTLDLNVFEINSFEAGFLMIGGRLIETPFEQQNYEWSVDMRPEMDLITEVSLKLDKEQGIAQWHFKSIDPATGELPENLLSGFLPPDDENGAGQGSVMFTIQAKEGLADDATVANKASIVFDGNEAIITNEWVNKKDIVAPVSTMLTPVNTEDGLVELRWEGEDNPDGSGIYHYDVYRKREGDDHYSLIFSEMSETSAKLELEKYVNYSFYTLATDSAGNRETKVNVPDISWTNVGIQEISVVQNVSLIPNPAKTECTVVFDVETPGKMNITLLNMSGANVMKIYDGPVGNSRFSHTFDTHSLPAGVYTVVVNTDGKVVAEKLLVIR